MKNDSEVLAIKPEKTKTPHAEMPEFILGEWGEIYVKIADDHLINTGSVFMQVS